MHPEPTPQAGSCGLNVRNSSQTHDRGEQQGAGVLPLCDVLEQGVDGPGVQGVFQGGPGHDGDGALLCEPLEDVVEDHGAAPWKTTISRCGDTLADGSLQLQSPAEGGQVPRRRWRDPLVRRNRDTWRTTIP